MPYLMEFATLRCLSTSRPIIMITTYVLFLSLDPCRALPGVWYRMSRCAGGPILLWILWILMGLIYPSRPLRLSCVDLNLQPILVSSRQDRRVMPGTLARSGHETSRHDHVCRTLRRPGNPLILGWIVRLPAKVGTTRPGECRSTAFVEMQ